jgi:ZU5 domain
MRNKLVASALAVVVATVAMACSDSQRTPLGPRETSEPSLVTSPTVPTNVKKVHVQAVQWKRPLRKAESATALIGPQGGVLDLYATGLRLVVPAGAVSAPTQFGVTAKPGKIIAYDFSPSGTHFAVPLRFEQSTNQIERPAGAPGHQPVLQLGYFVSEADLDQVSGSANVAELNDMLSGFSPTTYSFPVNHFSGYIVSWGFR